MRKQYLSSLCEEITINATSELLTGSPSPTPTSTSKSIPVAIYSGDVIAE